MFMHRMSLRVVPFLSHIHVVLVGSMGGDGRFHIHSVDTGSVLAADFQNSRKIVIESGKKKNSISDKTFTI
ncbi:hypothetical protein ME9_01515 [Bartonella taylorii 8TBB]|uniref:Uncharacterized protein n=1 Tax=Bartonella taylorii 8TBB TaxID=1094560 RepID=A0A9P2RX78_BARTA|nr:hypothetical protein ME9_01515 [Bartonella taylorii 8TBB]OPB34892.1 hypothetical protein Btaycd_010590 [Bartonella taylorii]